MYPPTPLFPFRWELTLTLLLAIVLIKFRLRTDSSSRRRQSSECIATRSDLILIHLFCISHKPHNQQTSTVGRVGMATHLPQFAAHQPHLSTPTHPHVCPSFVGLLKLMTFACVSPTTKRGCALYLYVYVSRVCVDALVRSALQYIDEDVYSLISNAWNSLTPTIYQNESIYS